MTFSTPGRLVLHVGLPKTATTTLQSIVFPMLGDVGVAYLGVRQPREQPQDPIYELLMEAVWTGRIEAAREALARRCEASPVTVVSEEMLVVGQPQLDWRTKLRRLRSVAEGTDHRVLVTLREPVSASFSFHVELGRRRAGRRPGWLSSLRDDDEMLIYRYRTLFSVLDELFGRDRLHVVAFEDVVKGEFGRLWEALGLDPAEVHLPELQDHNRRERKGATVATGARYSLLDHGRDLASWLNLDRRRWRRLVGPIVPVLRRIPTWEKRIPLPSDAERREAAALFAPDVLWLRDAFGIDYDRSVERA